MGLKAEGTLREGSTPNRCPVGEQRRPGRYQKTARTGWSKETNVAVMECYFLSRPFDEEEKPIRAYRKQMHNIWKERQGLISTERRLCDQMIRMIGWLTELEMNVIKKSMMNENTNKNDQNSGNNDNDDQGEATENECENLVNVLQNVSFSFQNVEGMRKEEEEED